MPPTTELSDVILEMPTQKQLTPSQLYSNLPISAQPRSIRVLDLDPVPPAEQTSRQDSCTSDQNEDPLSGTLRVVSLAESPKFTALSYAWGEISSAENTIVLRSGSECGAVSSLQLTANCHSALTHLRRRHGSITIWVDSICINQEDQQEKGNQIPLMQEIYAWASPVYVWLGEGNARSDKAMDYLSKVSAYELDLDAMEYLLHPADSLRNRIAGRVQHLRRICLRSLMCLGRGLLTSICIRRSPALDTEISGTFDMTCLEDLLESRGRPWSQRVWTLQEFLLAWDAVVLCGDKALHRNDFLRGLKYTKDLEHNQSFTMVKSLPQYFHDWCRLFDLWIGCERPDIWNGQQKRYPPSYIRSTLLRFSPQSDSLFSTWTSTPSMDLVTLFNFHRILLIFTLSALTVSIILVMIMAEGSQRYIHLIDLPIVCLLLHSVGHIFDGTTLSQWPRPSKLASVSKRRRGKECSTEPVSALNQIIQAVRHLTASDPKDRSYGMYGVLESFGVSLSTSDYEKTPGEVYQELYSDLLAWRGDFLRLLMDVRADTGRQSEQMPTWVPSLHEVPPRWLDPSYYTGENCHSATLTTSHVRAPAEGPHLRVLIQWHGEVSSCSGPLGCSLSPEKASMGSQELHYPLAKFLHWFSSLRIQTPSTPAYESISDAVFPVLEGRVRQKGSASEAFNEWYRAMMRLVGAYESSQFDNPEVIDNALASIETNQMAQDYFKQCCKSLITARRNLFITSNGYLGSGPDTMIEGDLVALVLGLPVPMILRKAESGSPGYIVVGPAFVHGLMKGEDWFKDNLQEVILV